MTSSSIRNTTGRRTWIGILLSCT
uniref:Uncharacterized protein n=1 Tax=Anguilla anguilla TaxID=7936 RepID=A0A0E9TK38_ANGAN